MYGDGGALVARITEVREQMRGLQALLDVPPPAYDEAGIDVATVELSTVIDKLQQVAQKSGDTQ